MKILFLAAILGAIILGVMEFLFNEFYWFALFVLTICFILFSCIKIQNTWYKLIIIFFMTTFSIFGGYCLFKQILNWKLSTFDTNADTIFSFEEQTTGQKKYFEMLINDLNQKFILVFSIPYSLLISIFGVIFFRIIKNTNKKRKHKSIGKA
jgi:hypothetical protein